MEINTHNAEILLSAANKSRWKVQLHQYTA